MHPESEHGLRVQLATALRERDEARAALESMKNRDYAPIKKWIEENAPDAVQKAYWIMVKAETERDEMKVALAAANARADAIEVQRLQEMKRAEADLRFARLAEKERAKVQESFGESLAAARRECDAAHRLALSIAIEKRSEWEAAGSADHASGCSTVAVALRATFIAERKRLGIVPYLLPIPALAAPAAASGEEGTR